MKMKCEDCGSKNLIPNGKRYCPLEKIEKDTLRCKQCRRWFFGSIHAQSE